MTLQSSKCLEQGGENLVKGGRATTVKDKTKTEVVSMG